MHVSLGSHFTYSATWSLLLLIHLPETALKMSSMISSLELPKYKGNVSVFISPDLSLPLTLLITLPFLNVSPHLFLMIRFYSEFLPNSMAPTSPFFCPFPSVQSLILKPLIFLILYTSYGFNNLHILVTAKSVFPAQIFFLNLKTGHLHINFTVASLSMHPSLFLSLHNCPGTLSSTSSSPFCPSSGKSISSYPSQKAMRLY